ncbi:MAG: hypothetical protein WC683_09440 [bacterium]
MTVPNTTEYARLLEIVYDDERIVDRVYTESEVARRLLSRQKKNFVGGPLTFDWKYSGNEAVANTIAAAQALIDHTHVVQVSLTRKTLLAVHRLDQELLDVAKQGKAAFVSAVTEETSSTEKAFAASLAAQIYGNGGGAIARLSATTTVNTATIRLANKEMAARLRVGQTLEFDDTDGSGGGAVHVGSQVITAIDYQTGDVTGALHWDDVVAGIAANDYVFLPGQFGIGWAGFDAYCPASAPGGADNFYGANRSVSPTKLAGVRKAASGGTVEDAWIDAATEAANLGLKLKQIVCNPYRLGIAAREAAGRTTFVATDSSDKAFGSKRITLAVPTTNGVLEIIPDPICPVGTDYFLDLEDFSIHSSPSGAPHMQRTLDGNIWHPVSTENQVEMRWASYANMKDRDPGNIMRVDF